MLNGVYQPVYQTNLDKGIVQLSHLIDYCFCVSVLFCISSVFESLHLMIHFRVTNLSGMISDLQSNVK